METLNNPYVNCTGDKDKCFLNLTDFFLAYSNLTDAIYFKYPGEMLTPWIVNDYFFTIIATYIATFSLGLVGNIMVITVILGDKASRNVTSVFLVSLAIADLLLLVSCAPLDVAHYFVVQWDSEGTVCKLAAYAETVSAFASVLNLLAVTIERFLVIVFPIRSRSLCTMHNCRRAVIAVWSASLILAFPIIFAKGTVRYTFTNFYEKVTIFSCKELLDWRGLTVAIYRFITLFGLPSLVMITCYIWVIKELWISTRTMKELTNNLEKHATTSRDISRSESRSSISQDVKIQDMTERFNAQAPVRSARRQVIKMLILVVILFLVCWGPRLMMEIYLKCCLTDFTPATYTMRFVFYLLPFLHSCLNPIVYCFMSSKFRSRLLQCCCKPRRPASTPIQMKKSALKNGPPGTANTISSISSHVAIPLSFETAP